MTQCSSETVVRVVVADDHPIVRAGIANHLMRDSAIDVVGQAVNGDEALDLVITLKPDVLVLDINMPGRSSVDVLQQLQRSAQPPRVLILTAYSDMEYVLTLLKAGAKGYALKDEEPGAILEAVRAIAQDKIWVSASVMADMVSYCVQGRQGPQGPDLSLREIEVLRLLAKGQPNQAIGDGLGIRERTVRFHLRNIYDKLGVHGRGAAIAWAVHQRLDER